MYTHLIDEDAYNCLTRANRATALLSTLLSFYGESREGLVNGEDVAFLLGYIWEDIRDGLEGCEELPSRASVESLRVI